MRFFYVPFCSVLGGFWCVCCFSLCLAVVRWAVDRRTTARATPVALSVGVILGLLAGAFGFSADVFGCAIACAGVCGCMCWRVVLVFHGVPQHDAERHPRNVGVCFCVEAPPARLVCGVCRTARRVGWAVLFCRQVT